MSDAIDVVLPWVDGSDPEWLAERRKYEPKTQQPDSGEHRFRDWGLLRYLFRGIEAFMPWVRMVHFVTWGHIPTWLNTDCSRLNIVRHEDYIPAKYLPTFSANPIELNFHRIKGLSEQFIYFNDDMFVVKPTKPTDFFKHGLPCDLAALNVHCYSLSRPIDMIQIQDLGIINEHFDFRKSINKNRWKWIRPSNGRTLFRTLPLLGCPRFPGFFQPHNAQSLLKSTYEAVWSAEYERLDTACKHKFREASDLNQWLLREWQLSAGIFYPRKRSFSKVFYLDKADAIRCTQKIASELRRSRHTLICINDAEMTRGTLRECQQIVCDEFDILLPKPSLFELC